MPMKFEDHKLEVLAMLAKINAPKEVIEIAKSAQTIGDLKAVCFAGMYAIGDDMLKLASGMQQCGNEVEAAEIRFEGVLAQEPWKIITKGLG